MLTLEAATLATTVSGLYPTSTYQFKLAVVGPSGTPGPDSDPATGDTLAAGCGPKAGDKGKGKGKKGGGGCALS